MPEIVYQPLVSIIVITYNSSKYVFETLESIKAQTYSNLELIIADDRSTDNTVEISEKWINENKNRFTRAVIVASEKNSGIPANINRGVGASQGEWIKCIAGDDLLIEDCISDLISFIKSSNRDIRILSACIIKFSGDPIKNGEIKRNPYTKFCSPESTPLEQYKMLLRTNMVFAATVIIRRDLVLSMNGFDERFKLIEDWPFWVKITNAGYKIYYLDKPLIYYRLHDNNLSQTNDQEFLYHPMNKIVIGFKEKELAPRLPFIERWGLKHDILAMKSCFYLGNNKKNLFTRTVFWLFNFSNPYFTYLRIRGMLGLKNDDIYV